VSVVRIAICRNAARASQDESIDVDQVRRLGERVMERSVGLFATAEDRRRFMESLPDVERKRWVTIFAERRLAHVLRPNQVSSIHEHRDLATLKREWDSVADLLVCGREHARQLELETSSEDAPSPEVTPLSRLDLAKAFSDDVRNPLHAQQITVGERREDIWESYIAPLVPWVERLVIIDRYIRKNEAARSQEESGLGWFLRRVLAERIVDSRLKLEIVTTRRAGEATPQEYLCDAIKTLHLDDPARNDLQSVTLWLADEKFASHRLHDRQLRFDGRVLNFGNGLVTFSRPEVFQDTTVTLGSFPNSEDKLELVEESCIGARWRRGAGLWLSARDRQPLWPDGEDD
jgi:hypothetical protein